MGAWGITPFENDEALDWMFAVNTFLTKRIHDGLVDNSYYHKRAAAELLLTSLSNGQINDFDNVNNIRLGIAELDIIASDVQWVESWRDPQEIEDDIHRQIHKLEEVLDELVDLGFAKEDDESEF